MDMAGHSPGHFHLGDSAFGRPMTMLADRARRGLYAAAILVIYGLAIMPSDKAPDLGAGDKISHIAAFLFLTLFGRWALRGTGRLRLAIGLSFFGALIEVTQAIPVLNRDASVWDWIADSAAIGVALLLAWPVERLLRRR
jgi:VanZ family protein